MFGRGSQQGLRRSGAPRARAVGALTLFGLLAAAVAAPGSLGATSADRAATHTYRLAGYQLDRTFLANVPASKLALEATASRLAGECPGVLAGAPLEGGAVPARATPRARGEARRQGRQVSAVMSEIDAALYGALYGPDNAAVNAFAQMVRPLRWSDSRIAPLLGAELAVLEEISLPGAAPVCADLLSWVRSGYRKLAAGTKELEARQAELFAQILRPQPASLDTLLSRFEGPAERDLRRRTKAIELEPVEELLAGSRYRVDSALGIKQEEPPDSHRGATLVARGSTHAGSRYAVRVQSPGQQLLGPRCAHEASIELTSESGEGSSSSSATSVCISRRRERPAVRCEEGLLTIEALVPAATRRVRLLLSDGRSVGSGVVLVPASLGGPAAVYVQALRGPSPVPVSLMELDQRGRTIGVFRLRAVRGCRIEVPTGPPAPVELARGRTPEGLAFTIYANSFAFAGHAPSFSLDLSTDSAGVGGSERTPGPRSRTLSWSLATECSPGPYAIVYGVLHVAGDTVLARTPSGLVPLARVRIPARLHAGGSLVYGAFATVPTELVIRDRSGRTVRSERLATNAREEAEYCEGFAEP